MQVTINQVRHAVHSALEAAFPAIPITEEENKQMLDPPRFVVRLLEQTHTQELGRRYRREYPFVVQYSSPGGSHDDMYNMAEQLMTVLNWITVNDSRWPGQSMKVQMIEGVLQFSVTYRMLVWEQEPAVPAMRNMAQEGKINGS
ncbi:hypothetical protein D3P09_11850 [Paenibacillus pinisoli]|uniref:DUF5072 domain-containing protein n=1 Tax=Paenibacillus pinisoli TaxID=1276110 RepID=A0A3A6PEG5_9BACL|nr:hypothetical protein [Paenibacillus pinisoli]RJX40062.1 hypothetical protein D3P09_11850 [Paenibacillus pinisoli]